ncbi:hypothetical protein KNP414_02220 [Paenibacillus mucilaginosus KNP414]|uniref:Uncharacterized protein n=1 Tax=Paenibacillus mucilaginosus (strain KNP414) TaxID=1036673 RepID=F8F551_PAEMK|nr:hypothetical protein KNP414_02220 [Paenibacillus mucilaginosus KNP414]
MKIRHHAQAEFLQGGKGAAYFLARDCKTLWGAVGGSFFGMNIGGIPCLLTVRKVP